LQKVLFSDGRNEKASFENLVLTKANQATLCHIVFFLRALATFCEDNYNAKK
jgi:hypothetical protein